MGMQDDWVMTRDRWPVVNSHVRARFGSVVRDDVIAHMEWGWTSLSGETLPVPDAWQPLG